MDVVLPKDSNVFVGKNTIGAKKHKRENHISVKLANGEYLEVYLDNKTLASLKKRLGKLEQG